MMMIRIEILDGPQQGIDHSFREERLRFGSATENQVQLTGDGVLPMHAVIELEGSQGKLLPVAEGAELRVNGSRIEESCLLQPQDVIQMGGQALRFKLIPYPQPVRKRKLGLLEWITFAALLAGALGQMYFLLGTAISLRSGVDQELLRAKPTPTPEPSVIEQVVKPTPVPESIILIPTPIPTAVPILEPTPTPLPEAAGMALDDLSRAAQAQMQAGNDLEAERLLLAALQRDPQYLQAKIELARMLGRQAAYDRSIALWEQVLGEADAGSMDALDARIEVQTMRNRKARLEEGGAETPRLMPTPRAPQFTPVPDAFPDTRDPVVPPTPQLVIEKIRMERFPESPRYDQFRMIYFTLTHQPGTPAVEAGKITALISFFEQQGEKVGMAMIPEPRIQLKVAEGLSSGKSTDPLSAAYDVPAGKGSASRSYYGAVIQVFVDGKEVNRAADPSFLLDYIR